MNEVGTLLAVRCIKTWCNGTIWDQFKRL